jgi:hypothetical protein
MRENAETGKPAREWAGDVVREGDVDLRTATTCGTAS